MPVTITAGVTFNGGGLTMTFAPPSVATAGWVTGGTPGYSTVQRITFATDTATASVRGPLSLTNRNQMGVTGDSDYGWFAGGNPITSIIDRITYSNDTATATARGPLAVAQYAVGAASGLQ